jgi:hypothetical protein
MQVDLKHILIFDQLKLLTNVHLSFYQHIKDLYDIKVYPKTLGFVVLVNKLRSFVLLVELLKLILEITKPD